MIVVRIINVLYIGVDCIITQLSMIIHRKYLTIKLVIPTVYSFNMCHQTNVSSEHVSTQETQTNFSVKDDFFIKPSEFHIHYHWRQIGGHLGF